MHRALGKGRGITWLPGPSARALLVFTADVSSMAQSKVVSFSHHPLFLLFLSQLLAVLC